MLAYYAARLSTVELNTTFYDHPTEATIDSWVRAVPEGFRFAVKAHHRLTQSRRPAAADLELFSARLGLFGSRLGPVLWQLRATTTYRADLLDRLLSVLSGPWRVAFHFKNPAWHASEAIAAIEQRGGAICHADGEEAPGPLGKGAFIYVRLRQEVYSDTDLQAWADRLTAFAAAGRDVFAYFKHETRGPAYAEQLAGRCQSSANRHSGV